MSKIIGYTSLQTIQRWGRPIGDVHGSTANGVTPVHILLLHTDDGRTGVGLGPHAGVNTLYPVVDGQDPRAVMALYDRMIQRVFKAGHGGATFSAIGAVDLALWDLKAQIADEPLWQHLGAAMGMAGHFDEALDHLHAAAPWMREHASADDAVEFEGNLAAVLDNLGRHAEAREHHARAIAASALHSDAPQRATLLANDALSRLDAGDAASALEQALLAQRIVQPFENTAGSDGYIAVLLAQAERGLGRPAAALAWCERAEAILAERLPSRVPVAQMHRAQIWLDLAQHARARQVLAGDALATARRMPPRYGVRWRVLLARLARRLGSPREADELLAEAAAALPRQGWPELGLVVRTEQALGLGAPSAAADALAAVADDAAFAGLGGAELGARLHLAWLAPNDDRAVESAERALTLMRQFEALHTDRAWRWLAPARALARAGRGAEAEVLAEQGREWLRRTAATQVPPTCVDSFLHQHPVHRLLQAERPGRA